MLSVVIATRNRVSSLRSTLESMAAVRPPAGGWEVVVVDNASMDGTHDLVTVYAMTSAVSIRVVVEPRLGKSWAVNSGIWEARGEIIAFTDDDVSSRRSRHPSMPAPEGASSPTVRVRYPHG